MRYTVVGQSLGSSLSSRMALLLARSDWPSTLPRPAHAISCSWPDTRYWRGTGARNLRSPRN